jgi:hypothetical protein
MAEVKGMARAWILVLAFATSCSLERMADYEAAALTAAPPDEATAGAAPAAQPKQEPAASLPAERMVIREASLRLRAADPRKAADAAAEIARKHGGFVLDSKLRTVDGQVREVELQLRVPQQSLDAAVRAVRGLGTVLLESVTGQDVTEEFVDVSARLHAQRTLETRLLALLQNAGALKDLLLVEQELARVRAEIEQKEGRVRYLQERTRMAAIQVIAQAPEQPVVAVAETTGSRLSNALDRGLQAAVFVTELMIGAAGAVSPLLLLALGVLLPWRFLRRRRAKALPASPAT